MKQIIKEKEINQIIVKNVPYDATEDQLGDFFTDCGKINNVRFIKNSVNNKFKGFAFIEFKLSSSVFAAIKKSGVLFQG